VNFLVRALVQNVIITDNGHGVSIKPAIGNSLNSIGDFLKSVVRLISGHVDVGTPSYTKFGGSPVPKTLIGTPFIDVLSFRTSQGNIEMDEVFVREVAGEEGRIDLRDVGSRNTYIGLGLYQRGRLVQLKLQKWGQVCIN
jgi:hypothetical protein